VVRYLFNKNQMLRRIIKFSHYLKLSALLLIMAGFAASALTDPVRILDYIGSGFSKAEVGVSSSVKPNPYNTIALQLKEKEKNLGEKESELEKRENYFQEKLGFQEKLIAGLAGLIALLFVMICANFYLDYKRRNKAKDGWARQN
jgi:hypothetical protein